MPAPAVAPGELLDARYRLADLVGVGGMAAVYCAHDEVLARDVAVKLFPPAACSDERERQAAEIAVLARVSHPGLVRLLDAGSAGDGSVQQTYIVMELVCGPTLADVLAEGPLTGAETARVGAQLAAALVAVHGSGVVHRDVKPANVLVGDAAWRRGEPSGPSVKLADFGIARIVDAERLTVTGATLGTATYLSPEQAAGGAVGPAADVYALGLVLLECLTGRKAFTGTVVEVAAARLTTDPTIPRELGHPWCSLLAEMTRRDPTERMSSAEAARQLADLAARAEPTMLMDRPPGAAGAPASEAGAVPASASPRSRRRRSLVVASGAALLLVGSVVGVGALARPGGGTGTAVDATADDATAVDLATVDVTAGAGAARADVVHAPGGAGGVEGPLGAALRELAESVEP